MVYPVGFDRGSAVARLLVAHNTRESGDEALRRVHGESNFSCMVVATRPLATSVGLESRRALSVARCHATGRAGRSPCTPLPGTRCRAPRCRLPLHPARYCHANPAMHSVAMHHAPRNHAARTGYKEARCKFPCSALPCSPLPITKQAFSPFRCSVATGEVGKRSAEG